MTPSNKSIATLLLLIAVSTCESALAQTQDKRKHLVDPAITAINGIKIASRESEIFQRLGKPRKIEESFSEVVSKPSKYFHYDGMRIYLIETEIYNLSCTGKRCQTERGVKVGDNLQKVVAVYGPGNPRYSGSKLEALNYPLKGFDSYLVFLFQDGIVTEIQFWVDYV